MINARPSRILYEVFDPFDDRHLMSANLIYDPRKCAKGFYRHYVDRMVSVAKSVWGDVLDGREPGVAVKPIIS